MQTYLYHHGVKGMKWGRRKQKPKAMGKQSKKLNKSDVRDYGEHGARRIQKRMSEKGITRKQARRREFIRQYAEKQAIGAAVSAAFFAVAYPKAAKTIAKTAPKVGAAAAGTVAGKAVGAAKGAANKVTGGYSGKNAAKFVMGTLRNKSRGVKYL